MNTYTSICSTIVPWCCGGRAGPHGEITREQAIRDYYELLEYSKQLKQQRNHMMRCELDDG